jgi:hypothetical protein
VEWIPGAPGSAGVWVVVRDARGGGAMGALWVEVEWIDERRTQEPVVAAARSAVSPYGST